MKKRNELHQYQVGGVRHVIDHLRSVLMMDMSLGKTILTLTAIVDLFNWCRIFGVLIVAPRRVTETVWAQQAAEWEHTAHLRCCILRGSNKGVLARNLQRWYHIYVINYESLPWLFTRLNQLFLAQGRSLPFNMIVLDELTRVKNSEGKRIQTWYRRNSRGVCMMDYFPWRLGLTGTPSPNGYWDLYGQYLAIDDGARLGVSQQIYKEMFFVDNPYTRKKVPAEGAREQIQELIQDVTYSIQAEHYLELPEYIYNDVIVDLPPAAREIYDSLENEMFAELETGETITTVNMAGLTAKCRQVANGAVLDSEDRRKAYAVHDAKLEALDEIMEEAAGQSILGAYIFRADMERIRSRYKSKYNVEYLGPGVNDTHAVEIVNRWNRGDYDLLLSHPLSVGHGLNLQFGGHQVAWFGLDYGLEAWLQTNARVRRQGQPSPYVIIHRLLARDTVDFVVRDALMDKQEDQQGLRDALEQYMRKRKGLMQAA